jgi:uncharacterized membrane protein YhhN
VSQPHQQPTATYLGLAVADTTLAAAGVDRPRWLTKPLLMPALMAGRDRPTRVALALCGVGDVALMGRSRAAFSTGLGCFLGGQIAWVAALRGRGSGGRLKRQPALGLPVVAAWLVLNAYLWGRTGRDRVPVVLYSTALAGTALVAVDTGDPVTAAGGALFMASDSLIALKRFAGLQLPLHEGWVMATYAAAQALLAAGGAQDPRANDHSGAQAPKGVRSPEPKGATSPRT